MGQDLKELEGENIQFIEYEDLLREKVKEVEVC